jgi:uncharacterized membrane protein YhaH (DUF805 family)
MNNDYPTSFNPVSAFVYCMKHYADFNGRARRSEFWMFALVIFFINVVLNVLVSIIGEPVDMTAVMSGDIAGLMAASGMGVVDIISNLVSLALLIPSLAVGARRMHDIGKSGWWQVINIVVCIGWIIFIVFTCSDSAPDNEYGSNPKCHTPTSD